VSLTYTLYIDAPAGQVQTAISSARTVDDHDGEFTLESGLHFSIDEISGGKWTVAEDMGIKPRSAVRFFLDKSNDLDAQQIALLRITLDLLGLIPGDAVLLFNGEWVWLLRQDHLTLNRSLWNENRLTIVSEPYELRAIPSI